MATDMAKKMFEDWKNKFEGIGKRKYETGFGGHNPWIDVFVGKKPKNGMFCDQNNLL